MNWAESQVIPPIAPVISVSSSTSTEFPASAIIQQQAEPTTESETQFETAPSTSKAPTKTLEELVAEYGGTTSKAIIKLRGQSPLTIDQIIAQQKIKKNFIALVNATITDSTQRKTLADLLEKIDSENAVAVLQAVSRALGGASAAFQFPANFENLGMLEKQRILIRQREINEAEEACQLISQCLQAKQQNSRQTLVGEAQALVAQINESFDYNGYKTNEAIQLLMSLCDEVLPGAPGKLSKEALQRELGLDIEQRGFDLPTAMQTIGLALQNKGQRQLGMDLFAASSNVF